VYSAPGSGAIARARRASTSMSGRLDLIHSSEVSSHSTMPARAEHSVAMFASVARSSIERCLSPSPPNSIERLSVSPRRTQVIRM
jgi:hypothetical protein